MSELKRGDQAPTFCLPDAEKGQVCLKDHRGRWVVLYFYPKDGTKGCTMEALEFTAAEDEFNALGAEVLGVSPDSPESHTKFIDKHGLGVTLLSDSEKETLSSYGAWQKKKMYGREYMGVVRSTILIDPEGKVAHVWPKVKVKGHVDAVLTRLKELRG
ncbi:thioredoxin-dependent thiol peroxidase [Candidatus Bathyarchaeota archaeon]|nr:thioredoxin-dependent thiol peroxidase [Candidatus Bathyarchaeota archaeon]